MYIYIYRYIYMCTYIHMYTYEHMFVSQGSVAKCPHGVTYTTEPEGLCREESYHVLLSRGMWQAGLKQKRLGQKQNSADAFSEILPVLFSSGFAVSDTFSQPQASRPKINCKAKGCCRGLNNYQHHVDVYLRSMKMWGPEDLPVSF